MQRSLSRFVVFFWRVPDCAITAISGGIFSVLAALIGLLRGGCQDHQRRGCAENRQTSHETSHRRSSRERLYIRDVVACVPCRMRPAIALNQNEPHVSTLGPASFQPSENRGRPFGNDGWPFLFKQNYGGPPRGHQVPPPQWGDS